MERLQKALDRFDAENARDPNMEIAGGAGYPRELLYARRLTDWVLKLAPDASESLRLAARCQHLCRWLVPRDTHPLNRAGYLHWRNELKEFHARRSAEILREVGYPEEIIAQVRALNLKLHFPVEPESRIMEDALCLVFLEFQLAELAGKTSQAKVINALKKAWQKMTPAARERALLLPFEKKERDLIERALRD